MTETPPSPDSEPDFLTQIGNDIKEVKSSIDEITPLLLQALRRDRSFDELQSKLRIAENAASAWSERPLITGIHDAILMLRTGDESSHVIVLEFLQDLLYRSGVKEYGLPDEVVDALEVNVLKVTGSGNKYVVSECKRPGLRLGPMPLRKPLVEIRKEAGTDS